MLARQSRFNLADIADGRSWLALPCVALADDMSAPSQDAALASRASWFLTERSLTPCRALAVTRGQRGVATLPQLFGEGKGEVEGVERGGRGGGGGGGGRSAIGMSGSSKDGGGGGEAGGGG